MRWTTLEKVLLGAFLFWVACGIVFIAGQIGPATVEGWKLGPALEGFIKFCLATGDPLLILLAFANTHLLAAREWGPSLARRWALIIVALSLLIETCGTLTGFPFGGYSYTNHFGPELGVVPMTIPLAWHVVLTNALFLVRRWAPHLPRWGEAAAVGAIATLYDAVLEPFAVRVKGYWFWHTADGSVPWQNYAAWFVVGTALSRAFAPTQAGRRARDPRPAIILGATLVLFIAALVRAGRW